jgi:hypothetical protein
MPANRPNLGTARPARSEAQRQSRAAMVQVMKAWEALRDEQRLAWDVQASQRRMKGIHYFKQVNLRRLQRGEDLAQVPPPSKTYDARPLLKTLDIRNRNGQITLELQLRRAPDFPCTVWASLPCNLGLKKPRRCPRLGWLPALQGRWCRITHLYFNKHGQYLQDHGLPLVGKRIFVRLRAETDDGPDLHEEIKAVVPQPEIQIDKNTLSPSKGHRRIAVGSSKGLRTSTLTARHPRAPASRRHLATA